MQQIIKPIKLGFLLFALTLNKDSFVNFLYYEFSTNYIVNKLNNLELVTLENGFVKVKYLANEHGSKRVTLNIPIPYRKLYILEFDFKFCDNFDFAKGGKLHGFGSMKPATNANFSSLNAWSSRVNFKPSGGLESYVYHQDQAGVYGDSIKSSKKLIKKGRFYTLALELKINDSNLLGNGVFKIFLDSTLIIEHKNLRMISDTSAIENSTNLILFNTFHGGNDISFSPRNSEGKTIDTCAYFSKFKLHGF